MTYIEKRLSIAFDEWAKRYAESPEDFLGDVLDGNGQPVEGYGDKCAIYLTQLLRELDEAGKLPSPPRATELN